MSGAGNDFLVFAARVAVGELESAAIRRICNRRTGVGADGVLFVHEASTGNGPPRIVADYYNADGGASRFCANGTRCAARLARVKLNAPAKLVVQTGWGEVAAHVGEDGRVTLELPSCVAPARTLPTGVGKGILRKDSTDVPVGVPHLVVFLESGSDLSTLDLAALGPPLRHHPDMPEGANANFVAVTGPSSLEVRSWERGVESETLSCGSGVVASAVVASLKDGVSPPVTVATRSGETLVVDFRLAGGVARDVKLTGDARLLFEGTLVPSEWELAPEGR
jgi:diaminopimelate epimerase